ncbi:MAG: DNA polymerase IV [Firmicutes bacterium]|nr:DNA polymerase IV [Bacillota bacterium]
MSQWVYGLVDMQSFYASIEVASRPEYALNRREEDDRTDPPLVVSGDPARRSGVILAATPEAKRLGVQNAMRLGEALQLAPHLIVVRPHMRLYLEVSVRIQRVIQSIFPLVEPFSVDEAFFAFPYPSALFPDPIAAARRLKETLWDVFRVRCRIGMGPNKWMAKVINNQAKQHPGGILWWPQEEARAQLHRLPVEAMWGLRKRAEVLKNEFHCQTIGDVAALPVHPLRHRFGPAWGTILHRWANGEDGSPVDARSFDVPHKGYSNRTTLPRDFFDREEIAVVILELLDEVCYRVRRANQQGRRLSLSLTYERLQGGFLKTKTLSFYSNDPDELYPQALALLDRWWEGCGVRAVSVGLDRLAPAQTQQLSLFRHTEQRRRLLATTDTIHERYGETSLMRASSLLPGSQLRDRTLRIGGHSA